MLVYSNVAVNSILNDCKSNVLINIHLNYPLKLTIYLYLSYIVKHTWLKALTLGFLYNVQIHFKFHQTNIFVKNLYCLKIVQSTSESLHLKCLFAVLNKNPFPHTVFVHFSKHSLNTKKNAKHHWLLTVYNEYWLC